MTVTVDFHFDFGSPNAYYAHKVIPGIEERTGAKFIYFPVLLGGIFKLTNNQAPMLTFKDVKNKMEYRRRETARFVQRHGLTAFRQNPHFPVNTVRLMRGAVAAQMDDSLAEYVAAMFHYMWEEPKKMDEPAVFEAAMNGAGLDGERMMARVQDQDVKDRLFANTETSVARGAFGVPTFFVGDEMFFGKDRLRDVEEEILAAE